MTVTRTITAEDAAGQDTRFSQFVLDTRSLTSAADPDLASKVIDSGLDLSMTAGAPMLTVTVIDPHRDLLTSGLLLDRVDVEVDRMPFRLVEFDFDGIDALTLSFEHRIVAWARAHRRPRKFSRGSFTRAEAIFAMFSEIKAGPIRFVSPDLEKKQAIKSSVEKPSKSKKDADRDSGFADGIILYGRSKSVPLTRGQVLNAERVLDACASRNAGPKATLACVEACIIEGPDFSNPAGGDASSVGILQLLNIHLGGSASTNGGRRDIELVVGLFLTEGFYGKGGAISLAQKNPTWTAGQIAQACQGSAFPARYDEVRDQAKAIVEAYTGGGDSFGGGGTQRKAFEFTRGQAGKPEDTWVASQRLAGVVRWRLFINGRQTVYYASDPTLMKSRARYLIDPTTVGLIGHPRGKVEVGGRSILIRGRREPKPSECEITVSMGRWAAPPGSVIEIADYGAYDGRWLVEDIARPPFDSAGVIQLRQPQKPFSEPAAELLRRTPGGSTVEDSSGTARGKVKGAIVGSPVPGIAPHASTHETGGLPSYPAYDYMAPAGTRCVAPVDGRIERLSGKDPKFGGPPGGPLGFSIYLKGKNGNTYYMTHLDKVNVKAGQDVEQGEQIAVVANGPKSWSTPHVHMGVHQGTGQRFGAIGGGADTT